ncbi:multiple epidermal growth factor-like domains protein 10, partial [Biomphalaria pfeifferi]
IIPKSVYVLTTAEHGGANLTCLIGALGEGVTGIELQQRGSYSRTERVQRYDVITVQLNTTNFNTDTKRYPALVVQGSGQLVLSLLITSGTNLVAYLVQPVSTWGTKYIVSSCHWQSTLQVISAFNKTEAKLYPPRVTGFISFGNRERRSLFDADIITMTLNEFQVYALSLTEVNSLKGNAAGLRIESNLPVGVVVSGTEKSAPVASTEDIALARNDSISCNSFSALMQWPTYSLGKDFVLVNLGESPVAECLVVSSFAHTTASLFSESGQILGIVRLISNSETRKFQLSGARYVKSSKPVYMFMLRYTVVDRRLDMMVFPILPTALFYNIYILRLVETQEKPVKYYVIIVVRSRERDSIIGLMDTKIFVRFIWSMPTRLFQWTTGVSRIKGQGPYLIRSSRSDIKYGCYLMGLSNKTQFLQPVGSSATLPPIQDERIRRRRQVDSSTIGIYSAWTPWALFRCLDPCSINASIVKTRHCRASTRESRRSCNLGFQENIDDAKPCPSKPTCPEDCPFGTWYYNCTNSCGENCIGDCDKFTGACTRCKTGYTHDFKHEFCQIECPPLTFGDGCSGSCMQKCGSDCVDRIEGSCTIPASGNNMAWLAIFLSLATFLLILFCLRQNKKSVLKESVDPSSEASLWVSQGQDISSLKKEIERSAALREIDVARIDKTKWNVPGTSNPETLSGSSLNTDVWNIDQKPPFKTPPSTSVSITRLIQTTDDKEMKNPMSKTQEDTEDQKEKGPVIRKFLRKFYFV